MIYRHATITSVLKSIKWYMGKSDDMISKFCHAEVHHVTVLINFEASSIVCCDNHTFLYIHMKFTQLERSEVWVNCLIIVPRLVYSRRKRMLLYHWDMFIRTCDNTTRLQQYSWNSGNASNTRWKQLPSMPKRCRASWIGYHNS